MFDIEQKIKKLIQIQWDMNKMDLGLKDFYFPKWKKFQNIIKIWFSFSNSRSLIPSLVLIERGSQIRFDCFFNKLNENKPYFPKKWNQSKQKTKTILNWMSLSFKELVTSTTRNKTEICYGYGQVFFYLAVWPQAAEPMLTATMALMKASAPFKIRKSRKNTTM